MAFDRFFIGPLQTGLQKNLRPFLIADDAFELLQNAYVFRGRVRKRFGETLMGTGFDSPITEPLFFPFENTGRNYRFSCKPGTWSGIQGGADVLSWRPDIHGLSDRNPCCHVINRTRNRNL